MTRPVTRPPDEPTEEPVPARVRITAPPRQRYAVRPRTGELDRATRLGGVYLGSLMRSQLWLAAQVLGALVALVATLPLVFHLAPGLSGVSIAGLPLAWVLLGGVVYPVLVLLGWVYVRAAERNERAFAELMGEVDP